MQNNNQNNMNNKSKNRTIGFLLVLLALIAIMLIFGNAGTSLKKLDTSDLIAKLNNNEIVAIYLQEGSERGKVLLKETYEQDNTVLEKFPAKNADFWFVCDAYDRKFIQEYAETTTYADFKLLKDPSPVNWSSVILPILYISILAISLFLIYKMLARSGGKGIMGFGKNKMKGDQKSNVKFENVAGIKEEKEELVEIVDYLKNPQKYVSMGAKIPKGVLLVGEPGTGKTLLAKAIAGESGVPFFSISGSDFVEMYVGVGASRVRELFEEAKKNLPCIVFIDEIDAVGRMRGVGLGGGNDEREQTLNQLLVEMDGFELNEGLIVMAATNRVDILDPALTRPGRFDRKIHVYPPDVKGREEILGVYAKNKPLASDVDLHRLARVTGGFTGADLENLLNEAALSAARENQPVIEMENILNCVNKVRLGLAKTSREVTEKTKLRTAYHESGHAILCKLLDCGDLQEVSITPRGFAGGYTAHVSKDESALYTKNQLNDLIAQAMGGRIAEFLQFTDVSVGAENDIRQATEIARNMVTDWGMSDKLGFIAYNNEHDMFEERRGSKNIHFSECITSEIDNEVREIINSNYAKALNILQTNKNLLDEMAKLLMERETIYAYEVDEIISGKTAVEVLENIEVIEAEKKKQHIIITSVEDVKKAISQRENKLNGLDCLIKANAINEEQIQEFTANLENEYNKQIDAVKAKCDEIKIDFTEILAQATNNKIASAEKPSKEVVADNDAKNEDEKSDNGEEENNEQVETEKKTENPSNNANNTDE